MKNAHGRLRLEKLEDGTVIWSDDVAGYECEAAPGDAEFCGWCQARTQTVAMTTLETGFVARKCQCCGVGRPLPEFRRPR